MKKSLALLVILAGVSALSSAQDLDLRKEAVRLLEKASAVSLPPHLPNLERSVTFRVLDSLAAVREGTFTRVVIQGSGRRDEFTFGDYHAVNVFGQGTLTTSRSSEVAPPEVMSVLRLTPIYLVHFDQEDVIRAITDAARGGRSLRCIQFDTIAGEKHQNNELCVDVANATLVSEKLGEELIENSEFFPFAGALIPARILYSHAGVPKLEILQSMTELKDATADVLAAPPDAQLRLLCTTYRRAIGESMPQPKPGNGGRVSDLLVRGIIGRDGKVHDAVVQSSDRPDLNAEALSLIQQWVFTPAMCNGRPNPSEASFVLHFQGR
jgi:hypothetical protein